LRRANAADERESYAWEVARTMPFSKRIRFGRRAPAGLARLEFSSELRAVGPDEARRGLPRPEVSFRWEPLPGREADPRSDGERP
jgi:hypothetical protein